MFRRERFIFQIQSGVFVTGESLVVLDPLQEVDLIDGVPSDDDLTLSLLFDGGDDSAREELDLLLDAHRARPNLFTRIVYDDLLWMATTKSGTQSVRLNPTSVTHIQRA